MVEPAAGQLMHVRRLLTIGADFSLEQFQVEAEELVPHQHLEFIIVVVDALQTYLTSVIGAL